MADPGFSPGGGANSQNCYYFSHFYRKLHENERIWTPRGGRASLAPPLGSANGDILARLRFGHQRPLNHRCPARLGHQRPVNRGCPRVSKPVSQDIQSICYCLHTGIFRLDTCVLVVAGVRISISPKYLYLYLALKLLTLISLVKQEHLPSVFAAAPRPPPSVFISWDISFAFSSLSSRISLSVGLSFILALF